MVQGGIFFDDLKAPWALPFAEALIHCALSEEGPYMPLVRKRLPLAYTEQQKQWQLLRRGRYIEFNLLYDRGVKVSAPMYICVFRCIYIYVHLSRETATCVAAQSLRASLGRRTVCGRTEQRRPQGSERCETKFRRV